MKATFGMSVLALLLATSCNNETKTSDKETKEPRMESFTNDKDAAKQQLFLRFTDELATDSSIVYTAKSLYDNDTVGVQIEVLNNIKPGINKEGYPEKSGFVKGNIKFSSIGVESDNLVHALSSIFNIPATAGMTQNIILPTVFSSNKEVVDLSKPGTYSFKLFLDNAKGEPAEVFAVVDTYRKSFEISEKDSTYRAQILSAFEGK